jgi:hypothetical protein
MSIWKSYRIAVTSVTASLVVFVVLLVNRIRLGGAPSERWESLVNAGEQARDSHAKLVFMLTTGFVDLREVELCLDDVKAAKASGYAAVRLTELVSQGYQVIRY